MEGKDRGRAPHSLLQRQIFPRATSPLVTMPRLLTTWVWAERVQTLWLASLLSNDQ